MCRQVAHISNECIWAMLLIVLIHSQSCLITFFYSSCSLYNIIYECLQKLSSFSWSSRECTVPPFISLIERFWNPTEIFWILGQLTWALREERGNIGVSIIIVCSVKVCFVPARGYGLTAGTTGWNSTTCLMQGIITLVTAAFNNYKSTTPWVYT